MKVLLIVLKLLQNEIAPSDVQKGQYLFEVSPLISQNIRLSELAPFQRLSNDDFFAGRLSRHRRAVPSASLDKSALWGY
jgi:hypothetical protein